MADILISYTSGDRDWAFWIGKELAGLGHSPHIDAWEISGGGDIAAWMEERHDKADHVLLVISEVYLTKSYSSWERRAAEWAAAAERPNFALPVLIEDCKVPTLLAHFVRCNLAGLSEDEARARLAAFLKPAARPTGPMRFPGGASMAKAEPTLPEAVAFPGAGAVPSPAHGAPALPPEETTKLCRALTQFMGPISSHLVREESRRVASLEELTLRLAAFITDKKEKALFLASVRDLGRGK